VTICFSSHEEYIEDNGIIMWSNLLLKAQMGTPLTVIKELMGHRTIKTTERYIHHYPADLRPNMKSLDDYYRHNLVTHEGAAVAQ